MKRRMKVPIPNPIFTHNDCQFDSINRMFYTQLKKEEEQYFEEDD